MSHGAKEERRVYFFIQHVSFQYDGRIKVGSDSGNYGVGGSVTKINDLLSSLAPCDNTSSVQQMAKDQQKLSKQYYWRNLIQHRHAQMPRSSA
ncbi:MAG TPA: hypothetical protein VEX65_05720 [Flavisolibacter sp.]|nr:hypothetical protein [Flavisolibacter sp.]